jgi:hypothetical protein
MATDYEALYAEWSTALDAFTKASEKVREVLRKMTRATPPEIMIEMIAAQADWKEAKERLEAAADKL